MCLEVRQAMALLGPELNHDTRGGDFDADAMFFSQRARIVDLAAKHQLPAF
jgi:hypothetical protein